MRFKTTLAVPNLHLSAHVLCVYHLDVKLQLQLTKFRIFSDERFAKRGDNFVTINRQTKTIFLEREFKN